MSIEVQGEKIKFTGGYRADTGPLPTVEYELVNCWKLGDEILKAVFKVDKVPTRDNQVIFYNYETPIALVPTRSKYKYFVVGGIAGMIVRKYKPGTLEIKDCIGNSQEILLYGDK